MAATMLWQPQLPEKYRTMGDEALKFAISARKAQLGKDLIILGHHYQCDEVVEFADFTGDSFKLSQLAAEQVAKVGAKHVVFCGVHFMAETADILANAKGTEGVKVILPDASAGCSMADMASYEQVLDCWESLAEVNRGRSVRVVPICYMNSTAAIKAFCGERGGAVCTSSNASKVIAWAMKGGDSPLAPGESVQIVFIPDQHLGRNTGAAAGVDPVTQMCVWDPKLDLGGNDADTLRRSVFVLWKGHCSVHKMFRPEHVDQVRAAWPEVTVIAHPECSYEVCQKAGKTGSTEGIIKALADAKPGTYWAIATEVHLVNRLCNEAAKRGVHCRILSECQCLCTTMVRIDLPHLLWTLDTIVEGKPANVIAVHPDAKKWALVALQRMLEITAGK